jgi:TP901 family phage tail tape measure protein
MFTSGSPNSGQLQIGIALVLQDRFSNQAREASSQIRRLHQEAKVATNANLNAVKNMATAGAGIGVAVSSGLWGAMKQGANFIDIMTQVGAIAKKDGVTINQLFEQAQSLGKKTMFDSQDIASGMQYFAMAGMSTREIKNNIAAAANLAGATKHELGGKGGAADLMTNIMKMFKIDSSEVNAARVADVLTTAVTRSNMSLTDLAESIKYAGTTTTNLGASLEQTAAFAGVLGNAGIQGSMAGTAMANAYRYLVRSIGSPKFKGGKALANLGLGKEDFLDANGKLIDIGLAMAKINKASQGLDDVSRFNLLVDILGVRGERGGSVMIKAFDEYGKLLEEIQSGSQGKASSIMEQRMSTIAGAMDAMRSTLENLQSTYTSVVAPLVTPIFKTISFLLEGIRAVLNIPVVGTLITGLITIGTALFTIKMGLIALKATLRLTFNDSLVTIRNMFAVMQTGWKGSTISAAQYLATHNAIIAQQKAGIMANGARAYAAGASAHWASMGAAAMANNLGQWVGNARQSASGYYWVRNASGGIKRTTAEKAASMAGRGLRAAAGPAAGAAAMAAGASARGLFGAGILRGLMSVMGKGVGLLGGPVGIGITAIAFLLPSIISGVSSLRQANRENTDALLSSIELERQKLAEERRKNKGLTNEEQMVLMIKSLQDLTNSIRTNKPMYTVVVNMDGKEVIKKVVRETIVQETVNVVGK